MSDVVFESLSSNLCAINWIVPDFLEFENTCHRSNTSCLPNYIFFLSFDLHDVFVTYMHTYSGVMWVTQIRVTQLLITFDFFCDDIHKCGFGGGTYLSIGRLGYIVHMRSGVQNFNFSKTIRYIYIWVLPHDYQRVIQRNEHYPYY